MRLEETDEVAVLHMEQDRANVMGDAFLDAANGLLDDFESSDARALVFTGPGTIFSGGLDLPRLVGLDRDAMRTFLTRLGDFMLRVFQLDRPVVAAINGHAVGGGCVLALQTDYRIMTTRPAKIGLSEAQLGIGLPAGVVETLRAQVPASSLVPIALQGELMSGERAAHLGLVQELAVPEALMDRAHAKAKKLAQSPRASYAHIKQALRAPVLASIESTRESVDERFLDTWFSDEGRTRITKMVQSLLATD